MDFGITLTCCGYIIVGTIVSIPNMYFFVRLIRIKKMRSSYGIMIYGTLAGCGCGIVMAANGIVRLIKYHFNFFTQRVPSTTCIYESAGPWEAWINFQFASCLFAHSVDRLVVVCKPLYYFAHQSKIVTTLVILSFLPATIAVSVLIIRELGLPERIINRVCISGQIFQTPAITYIDLAKLGVGGSSIIVMITMLAILRRRKENMNSVRRNTVVNGNRIKVGYNKKQESFTKVACSANICNMVLFVIPGIIMYIIDSKGSSVTDEIRVVVKIIYLINTLNIAASTIIFHKEIRSLVIPTRHQKGISFISQPQTTYTKNSHT